MFTFSKFPECSLSFQCGSEESVLIVKKKIHMVAIKIISKQKYITKPIKTLKNKII